MKCNLNIEFLFKILSMYLQYNTIEGLVEPKIGYGLCQPEEAHSHPVFEGFYLFNYQLIRFFKFSKKH